ncbi:MAG: hypothetical protein ACYS47_03300 [Planctomycetota bacterium]
MAYNMLDEAYSAETGKVFVIAMGNGKIEGDNLEFTVKAVPDSEDEPFTFKAVLSKVLVEKMGYAFSAEGIGQITELVGKKALIDLRKRLDGGHDYNFDGLPYIKMYSLRDKRDFEALA